MVGNLYLVVITEKPTKEEADAGQLSRLLATEFVVASSPANAAVDAALAHADLKVDRARLEVTVIPFEKSG